MEQRPLDPLTLFLAAFFISAMAGVAALLRSSKELTWRAICSAALNSGALGTAMALVLFAWFKDNTWFLLGLCMLAGLGGMTLVGFILKVLEQGGINVVIKPGAGEKPSKKDTDEEDK